MNDTFQIIDVEMDKPVGAHALLVFDQQRFFGERLGVRVVNATWQDKGARGGACLTEFGRRHVDLNHLKGRVSREFAWRLRHLLCQGLEPGIVHIVLTRTSDFTQPMEKVPLFVQCLPVLDGYDFLVLVDVAHTKGKGMEPCKEHGQVLVTEPLHQMNDGIIFFAPQQRGGHGVCQLQGPITHGVVEK